MSVGTIYFIKVKYENTDEYVGKIGKTTRKYMLRMREHSSRHKKINILFRGVVAEVNTFERKLIRYFRKKYVKLDGRREYFRGNLDTMYIDVKNAVNNGLLINDSDNEYLRIMKQSIAKSYKGIELRCGKVLGY